MSTMSDEMDRWLARQPGVVTVYAPKGLTRKQSFVWDHVRKHGQITTAEAVDLIGRDIYANASNHVGAVLARMVKAGHLRRVKPGVFAFPEANP